MNRSIRWIVALLLALFSTRSAVAQTAPATPTAIVELRGEIDEFTKDSLFKHIAAARQAGATTVILNIDTYGGLVTSALDMSRFLKQQSNLHIIAFVDQKAISAGAMIALACDEIVMSPHAQLGDCAPISIGDNGLQTLGETERAKIESPILADFDDSARRNGYDPLLVTAMVRLHHPVRWMQNGAQRRFVDDAQFTALSAQGWSAVSDLADPIASGNELLTVNSERAAKLGLARGIALSASALADERGFDVVATFAPGAGDKLVALLGSAAFRTVLMSVFMLALYLALSHPGHGMAEVVAVSTLALLVGVPLLTGYAQWWEIIAILSGIMLLALEIFVIPGFGVAGFAGIALLLLGMIFTFVGAEPRGIPGFLPALPTTYDAMLRGVTVVTIGLGCSLLLWIWLQKYLPRLPYFGRLILPMSADSAVEVPTGAASSWIMVGTTGKAVTDLRPGGSASFFDSSLSDERLTDVVSDSGYVRAGTRVVVHDIAGNRVVVRTI